MVQTAGFDASAIPVGPSEGRRQSDREPDSSRVTPVNEGDGLGADSRRADTNETVAVEPPPRVAFTAKFGPGSDGFPLQLVRGDDVTAAESIDFEVIAARRISSADREVLLRAQEEQSAADDATRQEAAVEAADRRDEATERANEAREREDAAERVDVEV